VPVFEFLHQFIYFHEIWYRETNKIKHKTPVKTKRRRRRRRRRRRVNDGRKRKAEKYLQDKTRELYSTAYESNFKLI